MTISSDARDLYLDLLKRCLTNWTYARDEWQRVTPKRAIDRWLLGRLESEGCFLARKATFDPDKRRAGLDWPPPPSAHTMIGLKRLDNLQSCIEDVIAKQIPGDLIETGVWRGGATHLHARSLEGARC